MFALQLSQALRAQGWESHLFGLFAGDEEFVGTARSAGVWLGTLGANRRTPIEVFAVRGLRTVVREVGVTVVQANGSATLKYLALAKLTGMRIALVYRSIGMPSFWRRKALHRVAYRWLFHTVDRVVAVCRKAREELLASGLSEDQVVVIPNGVDTTPFLSSEAGHGVQGRLRAEALAAQADVVLVHVGSLTPEKNHLALIRLLACLRGQGVPAKLWLVGDGQEREALQRQVEQAGVRRHVWFAGERTDIAAILGAADIFVLPSFTEGMPAGLIEAGLACLPSVAFDVGGVEDVVVHGKTGCLVPVGDEGGLQEAVIRLARDPAACRAMGRAAQNACLKFDVRRVAAEYAEIYAGLHA